MLALQEFVDITKNINEAVELDCDSFYMEILSTKGIREKKEVVNEEVITEENINEEDKD